MTCQQVNNLLQLLFPGPGAAPGKPCALFLERRNTCSPITPPLVHGMTGKPSRGPARGGLGEGKSPSVGISKRTLGKRSVFSSQWEESHGVGSLSAVRALAQGSGIGAMTKQIRVALLRLINGATHTHTRAHTSTARSSDLPWLVSINSFSSSREQEATN